MLGIKLMVSHMPGKSYNPNKTSILYKCPSLWYSRYFCFITTENGLKHGAGNGEMVQTG